MGSTTSLLITGSAAAVLAAVIGGISTGVLSFSAGDESLEATSAGKNARRNKKRRENQKQRLQAAESSSKSNVDAHSKASAAAPKANQQKDKGLQDGADADFPPLSHSQSVLASAKSEKQEKKSWAEQRAPKTRQGKVADMLDPDVVTAPSTARVLQVGSDGKAIHQKDQQAKSNNDKQKKNKGKKAAASTGGGNEEEESTIQPQAQAQGMEQSWVDLAGQPEDSAGESSTMDMEETEDQWQQVPSKAGTSKSKSTPASSFASVSQSQPSLVPGLPSKKARQNASKKDAQKSVRDAAEAERLARLQAHRSARASDATKQSQRAKMDKGIKSVQAPAAPVPSGSSNKTVSGGMRYGMSESGNLIWE